MGRLFVALRLPPVLRDSLAALHREVPGVRWVPPGHLHLTIRFIGSENPSFIKEALREVVSPSVTVSFERVRLFPRSSRPRVLAATIANTRELRTLHSQIESALEHTGIKPEDRPFRPHVTLARCKGAEPGSLKPLLEEVTVPSASVEIDAFHLFESHLHPEGAKHTVLETYLLGAQSWFG